VRLGSVAGVIGSLSPNRLLGIPLAALRDPLGRFNLATFFLSLTIYSPILVLYYTGRGLSLFQVLSLEAFMGLATILLEVPTGVVADRIGLKRSVTLGFFFQAVWVGLLVLAREYWQFLAGYAVLGMAISFRSGASEAWIYETLKARGEEHRMSQAHGAFWAASLAGRTTSAVLAALVVREMSEPSFVLALELSAAAMLLGTVLVLTVPNRQTEAELARQRGSLRLVRDGIRLIRAHPALRRIVALSVLADPLPYALLFLFQPYYQLAGTPAALYGLSSAAAAALGALGARSAFGLERRLGALRAFVLANLLPVAGYLAMAGLAGPYLAPLLFVMTYGAMQIRYPLIAALQNRHIASYNRATTISVVSMLGGAYALAMKLIAGYLADIDLRLAFGFLALVPLVAVSCFPLRVEQLESQELSAAEGSDGPRNDD